MMLTRAGCIALPAFAAALLSQPVQADIYTWVDASGVTNVSNLAPPDGAKITKVQPALPPEIAAREDAAREAARRAEADAAAARIRDLENLLAHSTPPDYRPTAAQPVIQYIVEPQPAPMQLTVQTPPATSYGGYDSGCNPSWAGCALAWWPVVVVGTTGLRSVHPIHGRPNPAPGMPFRPQLTNVVSPTTGFVPTLTNVVPPVTGIASPLTSVVPPIPQAFAVQRTFNSPAPAAKRG